jgi:hypothetical protein
MTEIERETLERKQKGRSQNENKTRRTVFFS